MFFINSLTHIARIVQKQVKEELYNPDQIKEDLMKLQLRFELDQIDEEEYDRLEEELLLRLQEAQKR